MEQTIVPPPPCSDVHADCLPGYHNPPGQPCVCVLDAQPVPTLEVGALLGLLVVICGAAAVKLVRHPWMGGDK